MVSFIQINPVLEENPSIRFIGERLYVASAGIDEIAIIPPEGAALTAIMAIAIIRAAKDRTAEFRAKTPKDTKILTGC